MLPKFRKIQPKNQIYTTNELLSSLKPHFFDRTNFSIAGCVIYQINHPYGTTHGGTALLSPYSDVKEILKYTSHPLKTNCKANWRSQMKKKPSIWRIKYLQQICFVILEYILTSTSDSREIHKVDSNYLNSTRDIDCSRGFT